jgi:hypothetical protein
MPELDARAQRERDAPLSANVEANKVTEVKAP